MSSQAHQTQGSPQQEAPQSQTAKQGPAPEPASFGVGNAVEFQEGYGNSAVAGMAGQEGGQSGADREGQTLEEYDAELASDIYNTTEWGEAALQSVSGWVHHVPDSLAADANTAIAGLEDLLSDLGASESELRDAVMAGDEESILTLEVRAIDQLLRLEVATELVEEYGLLYTGAVAELFATILSVVAVIHLLQEFQGIKSRGIVALNAQKEALLNMTDAVAELGEVVVQAGLQVVIAEAQTALVVAALASGPAGIVAVVPVLVLGGVLSSFVDAKLGTSPPETLPGLTKLAGDASTGVGLASSVVDKLRDVPAAKVMGGHCTIFGAALVGIDTHQEGKEALKGFLAGGQEYLVALTAQEQFLAEIEEFRDVKMVKVMAFLERLPGMVEAAQAQASLSVENIAALKALYGDALYAE